MNAVTRALFAFLLAVCQAPLALAGFDYATNLGIAVAKATRNCLDIGNGDLVAGQRLVVVTSSMPQTVAEVEITRKADNACAVANQAEPEIYHYEFKLLNGTLEPSAPAFALANFGGRLHTGKSGVTGDLDGDGKAEFFRACTSLEGVHLTVWKGKALVGIRKWHGYYYLGYDVAPNCTRKDTRPDSR